jgi:transposase-like protein
MSQPSCPHCPQTFGSSAHRLVVKYGFFIRIEDKSRQQRYRCKTCHKLFSAATLHPCYKQKRRTINPTVFTHLVSGLSQRRLSHLLKANRKTIVRKMIFLAGYAQIYFERHRQQHILCSNFEFDDLETFEHTKMKPLSVTMAVERHSRRILGFRVAQMPAKGLLAKRARKKYGLRKDHRQRRRRSLLKELTNFTLPHVEIRSDSNPHYKADVNKYFPKCVYKPYPGRRGCVVGQGELKAGGYDPLFSINHSFAMLRANINRLFRRTWNTTKRPDRLEMHIQLYVLYHNLFIIKSSTA